LRDEIIAQATKKAREDFANQLKAAVNCAREMKDRAQCGYCPYHKVKDNGYYDCDIDRILRGASGSVPVEQPIPEYNPPLCLGMLDCPDIKRSACDYLDDCARTKDRDALIAARERAAENKRVLKEIVGFMTACN
jgi:hypothetical protein